MYGHILIPRFFSCLHVSHRRTPSHSQLSSSSRSSSNLFVPRQMTSQGDFPSFLPFCCCCLSSIFRVVAVVVVSVVEVVLVLVCVPRVPLLQNAHRHITVWVRENIASSSDCVSSMTTHSHDIVVLHVVLVVTAHSLSYHFCHPLVHFSKICSRIASCSSNFRVPSGLVVIALVPCTDICCCSLSMRILFSGISQVAVR